MHHIRSDLRSGRRPLLDLGRHAVANGYGLSAVMQRRSAGALGGENMHGTIGDLELGDAVSDGEITCTGCWDKSEHDAHGNHSIPDGDPVYWTSPHPESGECDAYCLACAEDRDAHFSSLVDVLSEWQE